MAAEDLAVIDNADVVQLRLSMEAGTWSSVTSQMLRTHGA